MRGTQEVVGDGDGDQHEQHQQEFALLDEIRLAGLEDDLGDVEHRLVRRLLVDLVELIEADAERPRDHQSTDCQEVPGADAAQAGEMTLVQVGDGQVGFAGGCNRLQDQGQEGPQQEGGGHQVGVGPLPERIDVTHCLACP
jgi:hypothetical protein